MKLKRYAVNEEIEIAIVKLFFLICRALFMRLTGPIPKIIR